MIRRAALALLAVTVALSPLHAVFEPLGYGAAAKGMGGAYVALAEDGSAAYWNPAGLALVKSQELAATFEDLYGLDLLRYATAGYTHPRVGKGTVSAHLLHLDTVGEADFLKYAESTYLVSYGRDICCEGLSVGTSLRYYNATAEGTNGTGLGFDVGVLYRPWNDRLRLGATWQDLNRPRIDWETGAREHLPYTIRTGAALRLDQGSDFAAQYDKRYGETGIWRFGLAHRAFKDLVALRGGLHRAGGQDEWGLSLGAGLKYKNFIFDYAWDTQDSVGNAQTFSVAMRFGK